MRSRRDTRGPLSQQLENPHPPHELFAPEGGVADGLGLGADFLVANFVADWAVDGCNGDAAGGGRGGGEGDVTDGDTSSTSSGSAAEMDDDALFGDLFGDVDVGEPQVFWG